MKIHLLSGFLGSGKTTALTGAAVKLMKEGKKVGVITNDQGRYQVDSHFVNAQGVPVVEVSNGCFCCNYETLDEYIIAMDKENAPDYIFAESVGSCTDLVATVLKPLLAYRKDIFETISLSTFTDSRILYLKISGRKLPFNEEVNYIIEKQLEEADVLVVNKSDLLTPKQNSFLREEVVKNYPDKTILFQNSLEESNLEIWISTIDQVAFNQDRISLEVDYDKYGKGEALLGWLDQVISIRGEKAAAATKELMHNIYTKVESESLVIGHLKFIASDKNMTQKLSYTTIQGNSLQGDISKSNQSEIDLLINARIETTPEVIGNIVGNCIVEIKQKYKIEVEVIHKNAFVPGYPTPTHRIN